MKKLGFGLMRLPLLDAEDNSKIDYDRAKVMIDDFMQAGYGHFDTAYMYHGSKSEELFRELVVKRYPRESYSITDKMPLYLAEKKEDLQRFFDEQLQRCGVEYFDYYWIHALNQKRYEASQQFEPFEFLSKMKKAGKIRHLGFSFHDTAEVLEEILSKEKDVEFVQLQINYLDWEDPVNQSRRCYEVARKYGKKIFVMEPIRGGSLAKLPEKAMNILKEADPEASPAAWALRFAAGLEDVVMVLSGMSTEEQVVENTRLFSEMKPLKLEEIVLLEQVVEHVKESMKIACTACRYCTDDCPEHIAIPEYFALYNDFIDHGDPDDPVLRESLERISQNHGKPWDCIACRQCEEQCPQILPIVENMKKLSEVFRRD